MVPLLAFYGPCHLVSLPLCYLEHYREQSFEEGGKVWMQIYGPFYGPCHLVSLPLCYLEHCREQSFEEFGMVWRRIHGFLQALTQGKMTSYDQTSLEWRPWQSSSCCQFVLLPEPVWTTKNRICIKSIPQSAYQFNWKLSVRVGRHIKNAHTRALILVNTVKPRFKRLRFKRNPDLRE